MPDGELISVTINDGIKKFSELGRHDNSNDNKSKYKKVCVGDIAYNSMRMWQGASGYSPYEGIVSPAYTVLSPNAGVFSRCIAYQFKLPQMIHTFQINSQGITSDNWNLKYPTLSEIEIYISKSVEEQKQIAEFFTSLDNLITLHQCKCDYLIRLKRWDFSSLNKTAWEQRKLGDISESYSGGTPTAGKKEYYNGDIPFIRSGEISGDKTELFITDEGLNNSSAKMVQIGYILYALYGATSGEVSVSKLNGAINQAVLAIKPHQNYDSQFLMQWLRKSKDNIIGTYLQGGQGNLSGNIVKELIVDVPTYEEQKEIGAYFQQLDNLITLHQRKPFCINRRQKWKQMTKMKNYSANIMQNGFQYIRKER